MNNFQELKDFLNQKFQDYNSPSFIEDDPIQIPHGFSKKEDIEISGFLIASIAWGQRKTIINNGNRLLDWMEHSPHDFLMQSCASDLTRFDAFVHRTFNGTDCRYFMQRLAAMYREEGGLEQVLGGAVSQYGTQEGIARFKHCFFKPVDHPQRTEKHLANPLKGSSAKRINMYLRWMVRSDNRGVDFGLWRDVPMSILSIPLDVHTGRVARTLGLLKRKQNDWKAVAELDASLRKFDAEDPVKYDFALFGIGVNQDLDM